MQEPPSWRTLLMEIITNPKEKQRLAEELGVQPITLTRWAEGESQPRQQNLRHLVNVLPQQRDQLVHLIKQEKGMEDFSPSGQDEALGEIPADFYAKVMVAFAASTPNLRFWSICNLVLDQAFIQLDPNNEGMAIRIVTCMPPSGPKNKVRSLREQYGRGTPPWHGNFEYHGMFLGAESLAGNVVTFCRFNSIANVDEERTLPAERDPYEKSCLIYPILYAGRVAGAFLVSSTQYNYFGPQSRNSLVQGFTDLIALAFEPKDFYPQDQIALSIMPPQSEQRAFFSEFRNLSQKAHYDSMNDSGGPINTIQAEFAAWRAIEGNILKKQLEKGPQLENVWSDTAR